MSLSGSKDANSVSAFNGKRLPESSQEAALLKDVSPEIEVSDIGSAPSPGPGSQSPPGPGSQSYSGLLGGQSSIVAPIADLDLFIERLYSYYCEKGLWCITVKWIFELLSFGFTMCFSGFFLLYVDWNGLRNAECGMDAVVSGKPCDLSNAAFHKHPLTPPTLSKVIVVGYLGIFSIYLIFCLVSFFVQLRDILRIHHFFNNILHATDAELKTMSWTTVLEKIVDSQQSQQLSVVKDLSAHDVVMRLMRKENYLVGMLNKGVFAFPVSRWLPGTGPTVNHGEDGAGFRLILTKSLEWALNWCLLQNMFDRNSCVRRDFISSPEKLKKRLMIAGLAMLLLSPFLVIFVLVNLFLKHAAAFYHQPCAAASRRWSNLSKWIFREFNEVDHLFKHRINSSVMHATEYLKQFPRPVLSKIAEFIAFIFGGCAAVLIIIGFLEESLLQGVIFGRSLLWFAAVCTTITAITRAAVMDELLVLDPRGAMSRLVRHTHYMPKRWRVKENTVGVQEEFQTLFKYTGMILLEEMASIVITPFLLLFVVPKRVDDILKFIADFTVYVEGVGDVCSLSLYDFQKHGNSKYGSPHNAPRAERSSQGKMEKSFLSFQSTYPWWEPDAHGKQFLLNIRTFRDQISQGQGGQRTYFSSMMGQGSPSFQDPTHGDAYDLYLQKFDEDQKSRPYLLDQYYTRPHSTTNPTRGFPDELSEATEQHSGQYGGVGMQQHFGASSSTPFLHESVLRHRDSDNMERASSGGH